MAVTGHLSTVVGTQTRGSAVGTRRQWIAPNDVAIAAGVEAIVAELLVADALSLAFQWDVKLASTDGIEKAIILVSQDGLIFEEIWSEDYDPDSAPAAPGNIHSFIAANGWDFDYVQVKLKSKTAGGGSIVRCNVTDSIFTAGHLSFLDPTAPVSVADSVERAAHVYSEEIVFNEAIAATESPSIEVSLPGVRSFKLELGVKLTSWATLATLTIRPQVYFGGEWWDLPTSVISAGKQTVTPNFEIEIPGITGNFETSLGVGDDSDIIGSRYRFYIKGDVADATLLLYAISKVPY